MKGKSTKGQAGSNTGGAARSLIRAKTRCRSDAELGRIVGRSASVISGIRNGDIKNPPESLISALRKAPGCNEG